MLNQTRSKKQVLEDEIKRLNGALIALVENTQLLEIKINNLDKVELILEKRMQNLRELREWVKNFKKETFLNNAKNNMN